MRINLDDWQEKFIATKGDKILCSGRQVGKSFVCGMDAGEWAVKNKGKTILIIAPTERQAYALFEKTFAYINEYHPNKVAGGKDKPTKTKLTLKNKTRIYCMPVGMTGAGVRFLTIDRLYADECSRIPEEVWSAVTPMLLVTGGDTIFLSTLKGKNNRFYEVWSNVGEVYNSFTRFSITSEDCIRNRKLSSTWTELQRDKALEFLEREKVRMSRREYAQEYEAIAMDGLEQFFPTDLIKSCMVLNRHDGTAGKVGDGDKISLGVDVARLGGDETAIIGLRYDRSGTLTQFYQTKKLDTKITDTARMIVRLDMAVRANRIYIDDGGLGAGVVDILLETPIRRKVKAINNAKWVYSMKKEEKNLQKEHIYNNLLRLMEQGKVKLFKDTALFQSLDSIQAEDVNGKIRIFGKYTHLTEALVRAAWIAKEKGLNLWVC